MLVVEGHRGVELWVVHGIDRLETSLLGVVAVLGNASGEDRRLADVCLVAVGEYVDHGPALYAILGDAPGELNGELLCEVAGKIGLANDETGALLPVATEGGNDLRELRLVPSGAEGTRPRPRQTRKASALAEKETLPLTEASGSG